MTKLRSYRELRRLRTFEERFAYLSLKGQVGEETFGFDRWINQQFYTSPEWRSARHGIIVRDGGCDLGVRGYEINRGLLIHHINPLTPKDIEHGSDWIVDPEYLITTTQRTHNAIHYGSDSLLPKPFVERSSGDTKLW